MHPMPSHPLMLAQFGRPPAIKPLPSPPFLEHYLLEDPIPLALILLGAAVVTLFVLNRKGKLRRGVAIGAALALAAAGVWALASIVSTNRERAADATDRLVGAAARVDIPAIDRL